uniref:glucose-6-phosphate dehydrogenase n=1 Tax=Paractinoplanes polyasparticus TaxID=2856853 RepID=UPI001C848B0B|nr:glucose-6-phosphate dehydrogenase [Actinoplanes polyasparticus]
MNDDDQTLLLLGASGDLAGRLLLPGLGSLLAAEPGPGLLLIGSGQEDWSDDRWQERVVKSFGTDEGRAGDTARATRYLQADATDEKDLRRLLDACQGQVTIFFALPPVVTAQVCRTLNKIGLPSGTRLAMEKPFGTDAAGAADLNALLAGLVPESQIHRIDHFLGKSTVLNILGLRFANRVFEPLLNADHVESVDIVFDESLGLECRAGYYDGAGALTDMVQSHLLQVLALLTMEAPPTIDARELRDRKAQVLRATRVWGDDPQTYSRRARYSAGVVDGRRLIAYADEDGIDPSRQTETLAEVVLAVDNWRWSGVPFRLRSGKALVNTRKEAVVTFRSPARVPTGLTGYDRANQLRIGLGPDRLSFDVNVNGPGDPFRIDAATLEAGFGPGHLPPYGEILHGALEGDPTLSVRGDTAEECWRIVEPVLRAWRAGEVPLLEYPAGSTGPTGSLLPDRTSF